MAKISDESCTASLPGQFFESWSINEQCGRCGHPLTQHRADHEKCVQCVTNTRIRKLEEAVAALNG